jgi:hypothetical protein
MGVWFSFVVVSDLHFQSGVIAVPLLRDREYRTRPGPGMGCPWDDFATPCE